MRVRSLSPPDRRRKAKILILALLALMMNGSAASRAQTAVMPSACAQLPVAAIETALGLTLQRGSALEDRLGEFARTLCNFHSETGDSIDIVEWTRRDRRAMPAAPRNAADCDLTCVQAGREPNLYSYMQRHFAASSCVIRQPRRDRDVNAGPLTACYNTTPGRRRVIAVQRPPGAAPAAIDKVHLAFDRLIAAR